MNGISTTSPVTITTNEEQQIPLSWKPGDDDDSKLSETQAKYVFTPSKQARFLTKMWQHNLAPIESGPIQTARDSVLQLFFEIVKERRYVTNDPINGNYPMMWGGFFYKNEVAPVYRTDRIPERLKALYKTRFVDKDHLKEFSLESRRVTYPTVSAIIEAAVVNEKPVTIDCGRIASMLQMHAYASIRDDQPLNAINSIFLSAPSDMDQLINGVYSDVPNPPKMMDWEVCESPISSYEQLSFVPRPLDMCYLTNDRRYTNYPESSQGTAFDTSLEWVTPQIAVGPSSGFWLTYIGKREEDGFSLYIGFGEDEPMTLREWKLHLKDEFIRKWGNAPDDFDVSLEMYRSPVLAAIDKTNKA